MRAEFWGSMARFPRARAARFCTVSVVTFLFKMSTEMVENKGRVKLQLGQNKKSFHTAVA